MGEIVEVDKETYEKLLEAVDFLDCLAHCGVDSWSGYEEAQEMMELLTDD